LGVGITGLRLSVGRLWGGLCQAATSWVGLRGLARSVLAASERQREDESQKKK
jgi:hypothetical protein